MFRRTPARSKHEKYGKAQQGTAPHYKATALRYYTYPAPTPAPLPGSNLDGEVDEVGVDEDVVRRAEGGVVREEHGSGDLFHVIRLRLFRLCKKHERWLRNVVAMDMELFTREREG